MSQPGAKVETGPAAQTAEVPEGAVIVDGVVYSADGKVRMGEIINGDFVPDAGAIASVGASTIDSAVGKVAEGKVAGIGLGEAAERAGVIQDGNAFASLTPFFEQMGFKADGEWSWAEGVTYLGGPAVLAGLVFWMLTTKAHINLPKIVRS